MLDKSALSEERVTTWSHVPPSAEDGGETVVSTDVLFLRRMIQEARNDLKRSRDTNLELVRAIRTVCDSLDGLAERYRISSAAEGLS